MIPDGIHPSISNDAHHADPAVGSSGLRLLQRSPAHYYAACRDENRERREPTPAMALGTAWHCATFEPARFFAEHVQIPRGLDRRTKEGKTLWADLEASGKTPLPADQWDAITTMAHMARQHAVSRVIFDPDLGGQAETSMFWTDPDTGLRCKIRPDWYIPPCAQFPGGLIVDGKSTGDAGPDAFARSAWDWDMHLQAAWYCDGFQRVMRTTQAPTFCWLAQEKETPWATAYYAADADLIAYGRRLYRGLLRTLAECEASGRWPAYSQQVQTLQLPPWAAKIVQDSASAAA